MAKKRCKPSPFLYFVIPIVIFVIFGDLLFDIGFLSTTKEISATFRSDAIMYNEKGSNKPIFFETERYIKLTEYHSNLNKKYPSSWIDLNNQLFCPIKYSMELNPINTISSGAERLLKAIYKLQFLHDNDCLNPNNKFLILDLIVFGESGLGAITNGLLIKFLFRAIMTNRTLLLIGKWKWSSDACILKQNHDAMHCYFLPISNCNVTKIIEKYKHNKDDYIKGHMPEPEICDLGEYPENVDKYSSKPCPQKVIHITVNHRGMSYHPLMKTINDGMMSKYRCNYQCFRSLATAFFYRLESNTLEIVFHKVRHSILTSFPSFSSLFNPMNTISLPIRGTDKCRVEGHGGEMDCWSIKEYAQFLDSVKYLSFGRINTVIVTSESVEMIHELRDRLDLKEWTVILNIDDTVPKSGSAKFLIHNDQVIGHDMEHDVIIGALSSLLLQMNSKYIAFTRSSNWLDNMWNIAEELNCEQIFWKDELLYKDSNNDNYYFNFNKQCFEFRQFGVLNKKVHHKHILYPPDLWDIIHSKNLTPTKFYNKFGVNITDAGWNTYCDRYMEFPFVDALHIV